MTNVLFLKKTSNIFLVLTLLGLSWLYPPELAASGAYSYQFPSPDQEWIPNQARTVVGIPDVHQVQEGETLLDIARDFGLGYLELRLLYPELDPWIPPPGTELTLPLQWVLPKKDKSDIVINLPELRLYRFFSANSVSLVQTYPVGIGDKDSQTPVGLFSITQKRKNPFWYIPESLQDKYGLQVMTPGPHNPLGDYWIGLGTSSYGLHGTNNPWSVGRLATNGCIRLYPEHIQPLFEQVDLGQQVRIIYEPVKLGGRLDRVYAEAHPDIYHRLDDYLAFAYGKLLSSGLAQQVDLQKFRQVLQKKNGLPVDISKE